MSNLIQLTEPNILCAMLDSSTFTRFMSVCSFEVSSVSSNRVWHFLLRVKIRHNFSVCVSLQQFMCASKTKFTANICDNSHWNKLIENSLSLGYIYWTIYMYLVSHSHSSVRSLSFSLCILNPIIWNVLFHAYYITHIENSMRPLVALNTKIQFKNESHEKKYDFFFG